MKTLANSLGILLILVGILTMGGWILQIPQIVQIFPSMVSMVFNAALCFTLTGASILILNSSFSYKYLITFAISSFILILSVLNISQDFFHYSLGLDNLFVDPSWLNDPSQYPGRMAQNTSIAFIFSSLIAILLPFGKKKWIASLIQLLTFLILVVALFGLLLYSLKLEVVTNWYSYNRMAIQTVLALIFVSLGWWSVWGQSPWYKHFYQDREDGKIITMTAAILFSLLMVSVGGGVAIITHLLDNINLHPENFDHASMKTQIDGQLQIILLSTLLLISTGLALLYKQVRPLVEKTAASELEANKMKSKLQETEKRYALAIQGSNIGLWIWEVGSEVVFYSPQFRNLLGYTEEEFPDLVDSFSQILHPDDCQRVRDLVYKHLTEHVPYHIEYRLKLKSGEYHWYQAIGETSIEDGHKIMSGLINDITERKLNDQTKNEFIATVNRDFRTPLKSINEAVSLILERPSLNLTDNDKKLLEVANSNCVHLVNLVNNMVDLEKIESGKAELNLKKFNLKNLLLEAAETNKERLIKHKVNLKVDSEDNIFIFGDYERIMQVVTNLLSNAAKFTPENGEILISMTHNAQFARVLIKDHGKGIPKEIQDKIFGKFVQAPIINIKKVNGTGLGLNICKAIIERHHGAIHFISEENKGTTFYFDLPLATDLS